METLQELEAAEALFKADSGLGSGEGCFTDTALDLLGLAQGKGVVVGHSEERANVTTTMRSLCHSELSLPKGHHGDRGG